MVKLKNQPNKKVRFVRTDESVFLYSQQKFKLILLNEAKA